MTHLSLLQQPQRPVHPLIRAVTQETRSFIRERPDAAQTFQQRLHDSHRRQTSSHQLRRVFGLCRLVSVTSVVAAGLAKKLPYTNIQMETGKNNVYTSYIYIPPPPPYSPSFTIPSVFQGDPLSQWYVLSSPRFLPIAIRFSTPLPRRLSPNFA